jgi:hypothetical protein
MFLGSIKFYPFVALLLLLVFNKKKTNYVYFAFGFLVICFSLLIGSRNFPSNWYLSFGSQVFLVYFERAFPHLPTVAVGTLLGVISGICIVLTINYLSQNALQHLMRIHVFNFSYENMSFPKQIENPIFTVCCLVHIFSYFAGTNYDYRLIFLTTAILLGEGELSEVLNYTKFLIWGFLTLFVGSAYSAPMGVLPVLQFIGDLSHSVILVVLFFTVFRARDTKERRVAYS